MHKRLMMVDYIPLYSDMYSNIDPTGFRYLADADDFILRFLMPQKTDVKVSYGKS
jgi:hypothetical protein